MAETPQLRQKFVMDEEYCAASMAKHLTQILVFYFFSLTFWIYDQILRGQRAEWVIFENNSSFFHFQILYAQ